MRSLLLLGVLLFVQWNVVVVEGAVKPLPSKTVKGAPQVSKKTQADKYARLNTLDMMIAVRV